MSVSRAFGHTGVATANQMPQQPNPDWPDGTFPRLMRKRWQFHMKRKTKNSAGGFSQLEKMFGFSLD